MNSVRATNTKTRGRLRVEAVAAAATHPDPTAWICALLQASDSFYPTGGYAHSFGLEGLVQEGVVHDRESLRQFILQSVLPALRQADLPIAAEAWHAFGLPDWPAIGELCVLSSATKAPREVRLASENIGRQRVELLAGLRQSPLAGEFLRRAAENNWPTAAPVAAALEGRVFGAPLSAVLAGITYSTIAALLSAAMKLLRLGQNGAQSLLAEVLGAAPPMIAAAQSVPRGEIGWFNPWLDIASARHELADARMFIS